MRASASIDIARPRTAVFEFMDVPENQARISPRLSDVATIGIRDNGAKRATYRYRLFGFPFDGEVCGIEHDPPGRVTFELVGDIEGHIRWEFEPTDGGTRVTYTATYDFGLPAVLTRLLRPLLDRFNQAEIERTLTTLRETMEATDTR